jgi:hypothetical protein
MISGEYRDPRRVIAFNTVKGWSRDVSEQIAYDLLDGAYEVDTTLSVGAKRFIDRQLRATSLTLDGEAVVCGPDGIAIFDAPHRRGTASEAMLYA